MYIPYSKLISLQISYYISEKHAKHYEGNTKTQNMEQWNNRIRNFFL